MKIYKIGIVMLMLACVFSMFLVLFGGASASSINPNGQCMEGLWGTVLYADFVKVVGEMNGYPYTVNVCKYHNPDNITVSAHDFCYTVNYHWPRMYKTKINANNDYVCWIDWNIEDHHRNNNMVFRSHN